jgi:hypothetical protein
VKFGPSTWVTKSGPVIKETDDFVWVNLPDKDDAKDGIKTYEVIMPRKMVAIEDTPDSEHTSE